MQMTTTSPEELQQAEKNHWLTFKHWVAEEEMQETAAECRGENKNSRPHRRRRLVFYLQRY